MVFLISAKTLIFFNAPPVLGLWASVLALILRPILTGNAVADARFSASKNLTFIVFDAALDNSLIKIKRHVANHWAVGFLSLAKKISDC